MAARWRIRHKLMLGLGLVMAVLGLLLVGTLYGLNAYTNTIRTFDHRLVDIDHVNKIRSAIRELDNKPGNDTMSEAAQLLDKVVLIRKELTNYETALKENHTHGRSYDKSWDQTEQLEKLVKQLEQLDQTIRKCSQGGVGKDALIVDQEEFRGATNTLKTTVEDLNGKIYDLSYKHLGRAKDDNRLSMWVVLSAGVGGGLFMALLLQFFYRWTFYPIRDLQEGVSKVAQGNFEHTIDIRSGDEIQELATAFNDMTHRLSEMYRDLARQVNERSRQLVRSERLAGVGFLAAGVAHEINNPLASIAFCSEALERRLEEVLAFRARSGGSEDVEVITKYLRMIQQEAFRCKEITQRLLEFSRGGERKREETDLGELVQSVLEVVRHLQSCRGKELQFKPTYRVVASVNAQEIKSVVLNLIVNALDSMEDGGHLTITLGRRNGMAELEFQDTGCGMTGEVLENIFEPFFTRSRTGKGTGLGLSISHRIINQHGGEIEAVSTGPNQGSTFTVSLPLLPAEELTPRDAESSAEASPRTERRAA